MDWWERDDRRGVWRNEGFDSVHRRHINYFQKSGVSNKRFFWALSVCACYAEARRLGIKRAYYPPEPVKGVWSSARHPGWRNPGYDQDD